MCVRRFDDSLNSAIHNTLSRFATVFIDARAKGSTVGSCNMIYKVYKHGTSTLRTVWQKICHVRVQSTRNETCTCSRQRIHRKRGGKRQPKRQNCNDPSAGSPTETLLRLLLPLDDQAGAISQTSRATIADHPSSGPKFSLNHPIGSSDGRCVQRAGT